jgi:Asp-tRNA(Asn)/Glu-tRNA(Gln) amidotransferase A subunit family amidase
MDIKKLTIVEAHKLLMDKKMSAPELAEAVLKEAEGTRDLNAYLEIFDDVKAQA